MIDPGLVEFYEMLCRILSTPDPLDLQGVKGKPRGHRLMYSGDTVKRDVIKRDLGMAYVQWRRHNAGQDISEVVCGATPYR